MKYFILKVRLQNILSKYYDVGLSAHQTGFSPFLHKLLHLGSDLTGEWTQVLKYSAQKQTQEMKQTGPETRRV